MPRVLRESALVPAASLAVFVVVLGWVFYVIVKVAEHVHAWPF